MDKKSIYQHSRGKRNMALVVIFVFTLTSIGWNPSAGAQPADAATPAVLAIDKLAIPAELGNIVKTYFPHAEQKNESTKRLRSSVSSIQSPTIDSRMVILIQDAHAVIQAQENISRILGHLQKNYGVRLTALEGAQGRLEPILLKTFPELAIQRKILAGYEKRGELSGPEVTAVFQGSPSEFHGMEDWYLYEKNYRAYLQAQEKKGALLAQWNELKQMLDNNRAKIYNPELNEFEEVCENFLNERATLLDLLVYLSNFKGLFKAAKSRHREEPRERRRGDAWHSSNSKLEASAVLAQPSNKKINKGKYAAISVEKHEIASPAVRNDIAGKESEKYQELPGLIESIGYEKSGKQDALVPLVRKIADEFKGKYLRGLGVKTEMNFYNRYQAFMTGQIPAGQMLQYLVQTGREHGKAVKLTLPLKKLLGHAELLSEIKGSRLYEELRHFLPEVAESLMKTPAQRELAAQYQRLFLLRDMIKLELTHEGLAQYQKEQDALKLVTDPAFKQNLMPALEFYQAALERDQAFFSRIEAMMRDSKQKTVTVVAGGFHTNGLERILKEKGVAYAVVTPKIASLSGSENYAKVMKGDVSFKDYIKTTYFDALMRHASKALVEALPINERVRTLKIWRDNVICELAKDGRIAEAGKYLPYIDEILQRMPEAVTVLGSKRTKEEILDIVRKELAKFKTDSLERIWETFEFQLNQFSDGLKELAAKRDRKSQSLRDLMERVSHSKPSFLGPTLPLCPASPVIASASTRSEMRQDREYPAEDFPAFVRRVLDRYDLGTYQAHGKLAGGYKNRGYWIKTTKGEYFLKWNLAYANRIEQMADFEKEINHFVNQKVRERGYSWRIPYLHTAKDGHAFVKIDGQAMMIYDYAPGTFAGWGEQSGKRLKPTMEMMAEVHSILKEYSKSIPGYTRTSVNAYHELPKKIKAFRILQRSLEKIPENQRTAAAKLFLQDANEFLEALEKLEERFPPNLYAKIPKQLVHLDYAPIHLMYEGINPIFLVDWENVNQDTVAVDFVKGIAPFHDFIGFSEYLESIVYYQDRAQVLGNALDSATIAAIPYIHVLHRLKLAAGILDKNLTEETSNIDWPYSQMKTIIGYAKNDFAEFNDFKTQIQQRRSDLEKEARRPIETKTGSSGNILDQMVRRGSKSSNRDLSPITLTKYRTWRVASVLKHGDYNYVLLKTKRGKPIDANGYGQFRIKLKIHNIVEDTEIVNQNASVKLEFKYKGKTIYITRTPDLKKEELIVEVPIDLGKVDSVVIVFENAMATIRSIDFAIEEMEFIPRAEVRQKKEIAGTRWAYIFATPAAQLRAEFRSAESEFKNIQDRDGFKRDIKAARSEMRGSQKIWLEQLFNGFAEKWAEEGDVNTLRSELRGSAIKKRKMIGKEMDARSLSLITELERYGTVQEMAAFIRSRKFEERLGVLLDGFGDVTKLVRSIRIAIVMPAAFAEESGKFVLYDKRKLLKLERELTLANAALLPEIRGVPVSILVNHSAGESANILDAVRPLEELRQLAVLYDGGILGQAYRALSKWFTPLNYRGKDPKKLASKVVSKDGRERWFWISTRDLNLHDLGVGCNSNLDAPELTDPSAKQIVRLVLQHVIYKYLSLTPREQKALSLKPEMLKQYLIDMPGISLLKFDKNGISVGIPEFVAGFQAASSVESAA